MGLLLVGLGIALTLLYGWCVGNPVTCLILAVAGAYLIDRGTAPTDSSAVPALVWCAIALAPVLVRGLAARSTRCPPR